MAYFISCLVDELLLLVVVDILEVAIYGELGSGRLGGKDGGACVGVAHNGVGGDGQGYPGGNYQRRRDQDPHGRMQDNHGLSFNPLLALLRAMITYKPPRPSSHSSSPYTQVFQSSF
jgi:hypothetical protein